MSFLQVFITPKNEYSQVFVTIDMEKKGIGNDMIDLNKNFALGHILL